MTTKELITAKIIQDITTERDSPTSFDVIVTRVYNWLWSLGFDVSCIDYTLANDTYRRVYYHPEYGTLSVKLNKSSVRGDVANLVNFVVNMKESPTIQPQQTTDQPIDPPFSFTPISKEDLNQLCSDLDTTTIGSIYDLLITDQPIDPPFSFTPISKEDLNQLCSDLDTTYKTIGSIYDLLISRGYNPTIPNASENSIEFTLRNTMIVDCKGEHTIFINNDTGFEKIFRFIIIDKFCSNYIETYSKLFDDNPDNLQRQVVLFANYHGYYLQGGTERYTKWQRGDSLILAPIGNINDTQTWAKVTLYHFIFDMQVNSL